VTRARLAAAAIALLSIAARPIAEARGDASTIEPDFEANPAIVARPPPLDAVVPGALLVRARASGRPTRLVGARRERVLGGDVERWSLGDAVDAAETLAARDRLAQAHPELTIEVELQREAQRLPNDDGWSRQWPLPLMHLETAWDYTVGDPSLVVAVVDTGITDHPQLRGRVVAGYDFISDPGSAGDGDGRDADPTDAGDESLASSGFHGTHVAGIIGAASNDGSGMAGVDWRCGLQPIRVLGVDRHRGRDGDIADGIRWASGLNVPGVPQNRTPARVINLSFGGPGYSSVLQDAVLAAQARGSLVIASAGNAHVDASLNVPASLEGVLAVTAADPTGAPAPYANFGPRVDVMTPGGAAFLDAPIGQETPGAIWSTSFVRTGAQPVYAYAAGTSQAAAHASGVAALVFAAAPALKPEIAASLLRRAGKLPAAGCPEGCGSGLLDASLAVQWAREIEVATCGATPCGTNVMSPAPLRPEEGCAFASAKRARPTISAGALLLGALAWLSRRRAAPRVR
jgi:serine protease